MAVRWHLRARPLGRLSLTPASGERLHKYQADEVRPKSAAGDSASAVRGGPAGLLAVNIFAGRHSRPIGRQAGGGRRAGPAKRARFSDGSAGKHAQLCCMCSLPGLLAAAAVADGRAGRGSPLTASDRARVETTAQTCQCDFTDTDMLPDSWGLGMALQRYRKQRKSGKINRLFVSCQTNAAFSLQCISRVTHKCLKTWLVKFSFEQLFIDVQY